MDWYKETEKRFNNFIERRPPTYPQTGLYQVWARIAWELMAEQIEEDRTRKEQD